MITLMNHTVLWTLEHGIVLCCWMHIIHVLPVQNVRCSQLVDVVEGISIVSLVV